jgi:hypothetical protein
MDGARIAGFTDAQIEEIRAKIVQDLCYQRAALLADAPPRAAERGSVLAFDLEATFFDSVPASISGGFFDANDLPPWDTWIAYGKCAALQSNVLYSWVPAEFEVVVGHAVRAHLSNAYAWVDAPPAA